MKARQRQTQTRLSFQPLPSSSPVKTSYDTVVQDRLANLRYSGPQYASSGSSHGNEAAKLPMLLTPEPSSQLLDNPNDDPGRPTTSPLTSPSRIREKPRIPRSIGDDEEEDQIVLPTSKRRRLSAAADAETPSRRSTRLSILRTPGTRLSTGARRKSSFGSSPPLELDIGSPETSGDDDEALVTKPTSRRRPTQKSCAEDQWIVPDENSDLVRMSTRRESTSRKPSSRDFVVGDDEIEYISTDEEALVVRGRKEKNKRRSQKEQEELEDDLNDLRDSQEDGDVIEITRTRGGPVTTQRDRDRKHLELLKRRRAGERVPRVVDSDVEEYLNDQDGADIDHVATPSDHDSRHVNSVLSEDEPSSPEDGENIAEDDDFVVDDESQPHAQDDMPLAFTRFASSKPRELFVYLIEWLVKNKIAPAFSRNDELYQLAWNKVNDQVTAQAGSRLISAAWNQDFKYAILARPNIEIKFITGGDDEAFLDCDACNKTNHPARYEFKFSGHAYHKDTLEPVDDEDDSDDGNDDSGSYDQEGHLLPSTHRAYCLGRYCAANAEMGHKLSHWKYHLNRNLLDYLEEQGVLSADAIVAREKLNKKRRENEANSIVDRMQETGIIDHMWQNLQDDLEDARFGMEDHVAKGGRRNKDRIGKVRVNRGDGRIEEWSEGGRMRIVVPSDSEHE